MRPWSRHIPEGIVATATVSQTQSTPPWLSNINAKSAEAIDSQYRNRIKQLNDWMIREATLSGIASSDATIAALRGQEL